MAKIDVDLNGKSFGRWLVIETIPKYKNNKTYCLCRCQCGTEKYVVRYALLNGDSQSCGCLAKEKAQEKYRKNYGGSL